MNKQSENKNTPCDYSDNKIWVEFEVGNKNLAVKNLETLDFIARENIKILTFGFKVLICNQQIPEIVRFFGQKNIAIYQIKRLKEK